MTYGAVYKCQEDLLTYLLRESPHTNLKFSESRVVQMSRVLAILTTIVQKPHLRSTSVLRVLYQLLQQSTCKPQQSVRASAINALNHHRQMDSSLQRLQKMFEMGRQLGGELAPGQVIYV